LPIEEFENVHSSKQVWTSTVSTFFSKFIFALTFLAPVFLLNFSAAVLASIIWGFLMLPVLSYGIAKENNASPRKVITEYLFIATVVIIATHYLGDWASASCG
jgi:VIT1/CCC1 family predicted Fe2+/Mn2+ transporter